MLFYFQILVIERRAHETLAALDASSESHQ